MTALARLRVRWWLRLERHAERHLRDSYDALVVAESRRENSP